MNTTAASLFSLRTILVYLGNGGLPSQSFFLDDTFFVAVGHVVERGYTVSVLLFRTRVPVVKSPSCVR